MTRKRPFQHNVSTKSVVNTLLGVFAIATSVFVSAAVKDEITTRTMPVGDLCMAGEPCAAAAPAVAGSDARSAEDIYASGCLACHASGAAGAPMFGDADAWAPRIAKGVDILYTNAINGIGGMPARGLCTDCSDEEIRITVDYMISGLK